MMPGCFAWTGKVHCEMVLGRVFGIVLGAMQWICEADENGLVEDVASFLMGTSIDWSGVVHDGDYGVGVASEP